MQKFLWFSLQIQTTDSFLCICRSVGVVFLSMSIGDCENGVVGPVGVEVSWEEDEGQVEVIARTNVTSTRLHYTFPVPPHILPQQAK